MTLILLLQLDTALIRYRSTISISISTGPIPAKNAGSDIGENVADNRIR